MHNYTLKIKYCHTKLYWIRIFNCLTGSMSEAKWLLDIIPGSSTLLNTGDKYNEIDNELEIANNQFYVVNIKFSFDRVHETLNIDIFDMNEVREADFIRWMSELGKMANEKDVYELIGAQEFRDIKINKLLNDSQA